MIEPYFFDSTVTGQSYPKMLNDYFYSIYRQLPGNELTALIQGAICYVSLGNELIFFMQDGAPVHCASDVRDWLDENFPARWIGLRGAIDWSARSPGLTLTDFFLWSYLKEIVYKSRPRNLSDPKQSIITAFSVLDSDLCEKVCETVPETLQKCIDAHGHQFEHLN